MNPEDVLPPDNSGVPPVVPANVVVEPIEDVGSVCCGFCKSKVTRSKGEVLEMSNRAIQLRESDLVIRDLRRDLRTTQDRAEDLARKLETTEGELNALKKSLTPAEQRW